MAGWRTNELKEKGKLDRIMSFVTHLATCSSKEQEASVYMECDRGKLNNSSMTVQFSLVHMLPVEHFRRLLAQKSFFVVHVLCTCLFAFSLSSLSAFCYRICFDMEVV